MRRVATSHVRFEIWPDGVTRVWFHAPEKIGFHSRSDSRSWDRELWTGSWVQAYFADNDKCSSVDTKRLPSSLFTKCQWNKSRRNIVHVLAEKFQWSEFTTWKWNFTFSTGFVILARIKTKLLKIELWKKCVRFPQIRLWSTFKVRLDSFYFESLMYIILFFIFNFMKL